jgi:hypothetical protein
MNTARFWAIVATVGGVAALMIAFNAVHAQADQNKQTITKLTETTVFLCNTVHVLNDDAVQEAAISRQAMFDYTLTLQQRSRAAARYANKTILHRELSQTEPCRAVE